MAHSVHDHLVRVLVTSGGLLFMTGCNLSSNPALPVDAFTGSADLALFIQQLAREALAAFLF